MTETRIREWSKLNFRDPAVILPQLRKIQNQVVTSNLPERVKNLRTHKLKVYREGWEAALFCYGMSKVIGVKVYVALYEKSDYDAVSMWIKDNTQHFAPLQIKEVVPYKLKAKADIDKEIVKLSRYPVSKDTTVVIHINQAGRLELQSFKVPKLNIASLWLLGASKPDQSKWFITGDMLDKPKIIEFEYPVV